jgi:hypothetical protein
MRLQDIFLIIPLFLIVSCSPNKELSFFQRIQPVPKESGFRMDGYWVWGGSMVKVDGKYHLFASRWVKGNGFPENYRDDSEIVRAISDYPLGPFQFEEVIVGERDSVFWDSNMAHNPTIHKIDNEFVLFYIGSDFTTYRENSNYLLRRVGYATAKSIDGPWIRTENPLTNAESNNPAVLVEDNGIKLIYRDAPLHVFLAEAENLQQPFKMVNDNVWPEHKIEDFYFFKMNDQYHFICEDNVGGISGHERWGVHLYSENGADQWGKYDPVVVYNHELIYTNGDTLHCTRRERPQLLIQKRKITHLITGIYDGENSWCQPVELNPQINTK